METNNSTPMPDFILLRIKQVQEASTQSENLIGHLGLQAAFRKTVHGKQFSLP